MSPGPAGPRRGVRPARPARPCGVFFFQAEDGIRDADVTGVQTCALPILAAAGQPVVGTSPEAIHLAEDRGEFGALLAAAGLTAPKHGTATSFAQAKDVAGEIGYPVLVRPSYVLGGRGMEIAYDDATLAEYVRAAAQASPEHPVFLDRFLDDAIEIGRASCRERV